MTACGKQSGKNRKVRDHIFNSKHEERETREGGSEIQRETEKKTETDRDRSQERTKSREDL